MQEITSDMHCFVVGLLVLFDRADGGCLNNRHEVFSWCLVGDKILTDLIGLAKD